MVLYDSIEEFWAALQKRNDAIHGFDNWTIVRFLHTSDTEYAGQVAQGSDELGFQPLSIILANPFTHQAEHQVIKNVNDHLFAQFKQFYTKHFVHQLSNRFGLFRPEKFEAYTEYDTWTNFKTAWLEHEGKPAHMHNFPLLFDHMPKLDYWSRRQTKQVVLPYQRLIVTTYFIHKNQFFDFIIQHISDEEMARIKLLTESSLRLSVDTLFTPQS